MVDISEFKKERKFKELQNYLDKEEAASEENIENNKKNKDTRNGKKSDEAEEASFIYKNRKLKEKVKRRNIALVLLGALVAALIIYSTFILL